MHLELTCSNIGRGLLFYFICGESTMVSSRRILYIARENILHLYNTSIRGHMKNANRPIEKTACKLTFATRASSFLVGAHFAMELMARGLRGV